MKRRNIFLIGLGLIIAAGAGAYFYYGGGSSSTQHAMDSKATPNLASLIKERTSDAPPNVIILLADDLGWADLGFRGSDIKTPNIDRLAKEGMRLDRFYVSPICTPTRSALMTGRDPIKLGTAHAGIMPWSKGGVAIEEHFMPQSFKAAGYDTAMVGKWHLGLTFEQHTPNARGFDHFYGHLNTQIDYFEHGFAGGYDFQENGKTVKHPDEYLTDVHGDQSVRYIKQLRDKSKPFFLYVPFLAPHSPMQAKDEDLAKYPRRLDLPGSPKKTYAAMVDSLDQAVGRIMQALDEEGIADNTIILFFSDNGGFSGFGADNAPWRGGKLETYEGAVRVGAVMRWPEVIPAGTVNDAVISVMDLLPTLASAAGFETGNEKQIDGVDRWDAVQGKGDLWRGSPLIFTSNSPVYNRFTYGVLDGNWKLIQIVDHKRRSTEVETELYDLGADPYEQKNIADANSAEVERLTKILDERLALHPTSGTYVSLSPHPGWVPPHDFADVVIPADKVKSEAYKGFGGVKGTFLQQQYGDKGRIIYE